MSIIKQFFKNISAGWAEMLIMVISGLIITPILISYLGKEGYGVWALAGSIIGYLAILDLGVSSSLSRFVAKYNAKEDMEGLSRILTTSLFLYSISVLVIVSIILLISSQFSSFFNLSEKYRQIGSTLILLIGLGTAISLPLRMGQGIFQGIHRFDLVYLFRMMGVIFRLAMIILFFFYWKKGNLLLLAYISIAATLLPNIIMCLWVKKKMPQISFKKSYISRSSIKEIWSLSLSALVISFCIIIFKQTQIVAIGKIVNVELVTLYVIPLVLMNYSSMLNSYFTAAFVPLASEMDTLNKKQRLQNLNIQGVKISLAISLGLLIMIIFYGKPFLVLWLKSKILQETDFVILTKLLVIMAIGFCIGTPQRITEKMFLGSGRQWFIAAISGGRTLIGLTIGILLLKYSALKIYGMAIGWGLFHVISGIILFFAACSVYKINLLLYLKKSYLSPLVAAIILTVIGYFITQFFEIISFASLAFSVFICITIYVVSVYFLCLENSQKTQIKMLFLKIRS